MARGVIQFSITDAAGNVVPEASVEVRNSDTLSLVGLWEQREGGDALGNPAQADEDGYFRAYCNPQRVNITATQGAFSRTWADIPVFAESVVLDSGSWTPTVTFATPGDFSSSDGGRYARWARVGNLVSATIAISFTPTFSTASGAFRVPLPAELTAHAPGITTAIGSASFVTNAPNYPSSREQIAAYIDISGEFLTVQCFASGVNTTSLLAAGFNGGGSTVYGLRIQGAWTL